MVEDDLEFREIESPDKGADAGHDYIIDHGGHDLAESTADHDTDCHVEEIAFNCEFLEFRP